MRLVRNGALLLFCAMLAVGCNNREAEKNRLVRKVKLATVCQADSLINREYTGVINEEFNVNLAFRVAGPILKLEVEEDDYVKKGALIAQIDPRDYEIQLQAAQGQYEKVKAEAERVVELHNRNSVAGNDYDKAVAGVKMAEANLRHAKNQMNDTKLLAPASGYIQEVNFEEGEMVDAGMPIASLIDLAGYKVEIDIPVSLYLQKENFVAFTGSQPSLSGQSFPLELADYSKKANNNQLYTLQLKLDPRAQPELAPGMNAAVAITMKTGFKNKLCVPLNAVFEKDGNSYVWIYLPDEGIVKSRKVITGQLTGDKLVTVTSGVKAGEQVVSAGVHQLQENQEVEILQPASETNVGGML